MSNRYPLRGVSITHFLADTQIIKPAIKKRIADGKWESA